MPLTYMGYIAEFDRCMSNGMDVRRVTKWAHITEAQLPLVVGAWLNSVLCVYCNVRPTV